MHDAVSGQYHAYLSHDALTEEQMVYLKLKMQTMVPGCDIYTHMDGMKDQSMIESNVMESDVFVAFVTEGYLKYHNCRRELVTLPPSASHVPVWLRPCSLRRLFPASHAPWPLPVHPLFLRCPRTGCHASKKVTAIHSKKPMILLTDGGPLRGAKKPVTAEALRAVLSHVDEEGVCSVKEHNACERLIATIETGSTEHLKKKELNDLLVKLQEPKSSKLMVKLQAHLRGAAVRLNWLDAAYEVNIRLESASGLKAADSNGKSDPFIKFKLNRKTQQSKTVKRTVDPVWNEDFTFCAKKGTLLAQPLEVSVYDDDKFSFDDILGKLDVDLKPVLDGLEEKQETTVTLNFDTQGSVKLRLSWSWYVATRIYSTPRSSSRTCATPVHTTSLCVVPSTLARYASPRPGSSPLRYSFESRRLAD